MATVSASGTAAASAPATLGVLELLPLEPELALGRGERVPHRADAEAGFQHRLAQAGGVRPRIAARALSQQLVQSRLQAFEHGRGDLAIDDTSERPIAGGAGRPPESGLCSWEIEW